jgi:hypothetical protein
MAPKVVDWIAILISIRRVNQSTNHQADEELESGCFLTGNEVGSPPKDQSKDEEDLRLSEGKEQITPDGGLVRLAKGSFQTLTVKPQTIAFSGKGGNRSD